MASSNSDSWGQPGMQVKRDTCTPETDYNGMMDTSQHFLHPTSSFSDTYHVSPITSPETSTRLMLPQAQEPMGYHWAPAAPFLDHHQTAFSTGHDWQTLHSFQPHGVPDYDYTCMMPMSMSSVEFSGQAAPPMGSFSSTSSFDASFNNSFPVQETWIPNDMAYQYTLRPRLQLPETAGRDMSLEGTISPKLTRLIPTPSFQSNPPSPSNALARRASGSSSSSDGKGSNDHSTTTISSTSSRGHDLQRGRLPSPKSSSRRLLPAASPSTTKARRTSAEASSAPSSSTRAPAKQSKAAKSSQPAAPSSEQASGSDSRAAKDEFLLKAKAKGMTYKEIRRKGNFSEAESTLRGRYRTLTKPKDLRVRKPEWSEHDLRLLEQGVRRTLIRGQSLTAAKIPWREVAEYIYQNGGSYLFGLSTCRKRWDELVVSETARGKDVSRPFYEQ